MMRNLLDQLWELDKEKSFARCTIIPVKENGKVKFMWEQEMWIKPYPNPFSYGGFWAQGVAKTTEELDRIISHFKSEAEKWKKHGLCKIDLTHHPEMTLTEYKNELRSKWLEHHPAAQLSLM